MPTWDPADRPLSALVGLVFPLVTQRILGALHAAGYEDLRLNHVLNVFRFLPPEGARAGDLARQAGVTPQAMSLQVADLIDAGYLRRAPDPHDRRASIVAWGARGLDAGVHVERALAALDREWERAASPADVAAARRVLATLAGHDVSP